MADNNNPDNDNPGAGEPVYRFQALAAPAQARAVAAVREKLGGEWWTTGDAAYSDEGRTDESDVQDKMVVALAETLGTPDYMTASGEVHGIPGVTVDEWVLHEPGSIWVNGTLTRENAPALPWFDGIASVRLGAPSTSTLLLTQEPEYPRPPTAVELVLDPDHPATADDTADGAVDITALRDRLSDAVRHALSAALQAGADEYDCKTGEQYARRVAQDCVFTEAGEVVRIQPG